MSHQIRQYDHDSRTHESLIRKLQWLGPKLRKLSNNQNKRKSKRRELYKYLTDKKGLDIAKSFLKRDCHG